MRKHEYVLIALVILSLFVSAALTFKVDRANVQEMGTTHFTNLECEDMAVTDDLTVTDDVDITGDTTVGGTFEATGASTLTGAVASDASLTAGTFGIYTEQSVIEATDGGYITATGTYQPITSTGNVGLSSVAVLTVGKIVILTNESNTTITITDTGTTMLSGDTALGQYDTLTLLSDGTNMIEIGQTNN